MVSIAEEQRYLSGLLRAVADGSLSSRDALQYIKSRSWDNTVATNHVVSTAWHELVHFDTDEDIRASDDRYDQAMRDSLRRHSARLGDAANSFEQM